MNEAQEVGVAGLGFLGRGITTCLLAHGFRVVAFDPDPAAEAPLRPYIETAAAEMSAAGRDASWLASWEKRFTLARSLTEFGGCALIIESITEDMAAKQALFDGLEKQVGATVPITSNTSSLPITLLQAPRQRPERFAGMHWASPAYATRFLEIIQGEQTNAATIDLVAGIAAKLGKDPAIVRKDVPGFIANRIAYAMYREAISLLESGVADIETIDAVCRNSLSLWTGLCGPFRWMDISGGPSLYAKAMEAIVPALCNDGHVPETMRRLQAEGARGSMNGRGFYTYGPDAAAHWQAALYEHVWKMEELNAPAGPLAPGHRDLE
jgi:3-hydroxybutyryl-CoA dehydrogenase